MPPFQHNSFFLQRNTAILHFSLGNFYSKADTGLPNLFTSFPTLIFNFYPLIKKDATNMHFYHFFGRVQISAQGSLQKCDLTSHLLK